MRNYSLRNTKRSLREAESRPDHDSSTTSASVPADWPSDALPHRAEQEEEIISYHKPSLNAAHNPDRLEQGRPPHEVASPPGTASRDTSPSRGPLNTPLFSVPTVEVTAQHGRGEVAVQAWRELRDRRNDLIQLRLDAQEKKSELKPRLAELLARQMDIIVRLRRTLEDTIANERYGTIDSLDSITQEWQDLTRSGEELDALDDELIAQESHMTEIEGRFYAHSLPEEFPNLLDDNLSYHKAESSASSGHIRADSSPSALQYLSVLGDMDLLRAQFDEVRGERLQLEDDHNLRLRLNVDIHPDSLQALEHYDEDLEKLKLELQQKSETLSLILMRMPMKDESNPKSSSDLPLVQDSSPLDPEKEEHFRSLWASSTMPQYTRPPGRVDEVWDVGHRVKTWLLDNLQQSSTQRRLYLDSVAQEMPGAIPAGLDDVILRTWYEDNFDPGKSPKKESPQQEFDQLAGLLSSGSGEATADSSSLARSTPYHNPF